MRQVGHESPNALLSGLLEGLLRGNGEELWASRSLEICWTLREDLGFLEEREGDVPLFNSSSESHFLTREMGMQRLPYQAGSVSTVR